MILRNIRRVTAVLIPLFVIACVSFAAGAQRRRQPQPAAPPAAGSAASQTPPAVADPKIISTPDDPPVDSGSSRSAATTSEMNEKELRQTVDKLSTLVITLSEKVNQLEERQRTLVDLERLSRAEQRADNLRAQLREVTEKEANLQARADQIEYELRPEVIEQSVAVFGSTRPELMREQRRRQLESEKARVRAQLDQLAASRARLEASIASADSIVERIRQKIDLADAQAEAAEPKPEAEANGTGTPKLPSSTSAVPPAQKDSNIPQ